MKSVLLYSKQFPRMNLQKLSACLYYDQKNDCFYRLNVMPQCTLFVGEDVERREMMALTKFDPMFHMIQLLFKMKDVMADDLVDCLKKQNWKYIASEQMITAGMRYSFNKQKIFDFLEKKVQQFEKYLEEKNPLQRLKVLRGNQKYISADTVTLLKNEISPELVNQFVSQRFPDQSSRKISPQQEPQALKPKPMQKGGKKAPSKQPTIGKDQPTLFGSWGKKK